MHNNRRAALRLGVDVKSAREPSGPLLHAHQSEVIGSHATGQVGRYVEANPIVLDRDHEFRGIICNDYLHLPCLRMFRGVVKRLPDKVIQIPVAPGVQFVRLAADVESSSRRARESFEGGENAHAF